jgi:hypothetical protein
MKQIVWMSWLFLLGACKQAVVPAPQPAAPVQAKSTTPYATGVAAVQVTSPAEQAASFLALDSEGLRLFNSMTGASRLLAFGTAGADALRLIGLAHKAPLKTTGRNDACGAATTTYGDGLTIWIAGERFVGWSAVPATPLGSDPKGLGSDPKELGSDPKGLGSDPKGLGSDPKGLGSDPKALRYDPKGGDLNGLTTAAGIRVGSTRGELESAYAIRIVQGATGTQFSAGAMAGMLESDRKDARITALWAGTTCLAP